MFEKIVIKQGDNIFLAYMLLALAPIFMFQIEFNKPFLLGFKYLSLPTAIIVFSVYWFAIPNWKRENSLFKGLLMSTITTLLVVLMSGAYLIGINAWIGPQEPYEISGNITHLEVSKGTKSTSYHVTIDNDGVSKKLDVSFDLYSSLKVGEYYKDIWQKGSLGLIYKVK